MKHLQTVVILLLLPFLSSVAQEISGNVVLQTTGAPIPFAHVTCPESGEATMTDENGAFSLNLNDITKAKTIVASFVGYKPCIKSVQPSIFRYSLALSEDTTYLQVIEIKATDPVALLRQAVSKVSANHGGKRVLTCFYRMVTKNQEKYIQLSEASFQLLQGHDLRQIKLLKAREAEDKDAFNGVGMGIGTPVAAAKDIDITQTVNETFLSRSSLKKHTFFYEGVTHKNGVEVHEISFDQKKMKQALYRGKIYLDVETLAFVSVEYVN